MILYNWWKNFYKIQKKEKQYNKKELKKQSQKGTKEAIPIKE